MLDYVIGTFYPEIQEAYSDNNIQRNAAFFKEVRKISCSSKIPLCLKTQKMISGAGIFLGKNTLNTSIY